ncbi:phage antirepressor YoqD-like protein [Lewinella aquimaris]|uniref:Phage antirepressor YoqD-like protein n=1 Tax=Neolewinella aquimaris TaxID=1835722 RepID=A0A840E5F4_9BACT|nr:phage antirepressor YoqD-like protein [Neolewinella aquimaris]
MDQESGFICVTDMAKLKGESRINLPNWMRARSTVEFIEAWERKHNPSFNYIEFDAFTSTSNSNTFTLSAGQQVVAQVIYK